MKYHIMRERSVNGNDSFSFNVTEGSRKVEFFAENYTVGEWEPERKDRSYVWFMLGVFLTSSLFILAHALV